MKRAIRLGDPHSHGGTVVQVGAMQTDIMGKPLARKGDKCVCPLPGHAAACTIIEGDPDWTIDGIPVALEGHKTSCGATLISTLPNLTRSPQGEAAHGAAAKAGSPASSKPAAALTAVAAAATPSGAALRLATPSSGDTAVIDETFDEQLQFVNTEGAYLARVRYSLRLADGRTAEGVTDEQGKTARIETDAPQAISEVTLMPPDDLPAPCCGTHAAVLQPVALKLNGVATNPERVGESVQALRLPKGKSRGLTAGERALIDWLYGNALDYSTIKINHGEYLWFGLQQNQTAMTPNGQMWFPTDIYEDDFAAAEMSLKHLFLHEVVHVWQHQLGYPVKWRGAVRVKLSYEYVLKPTARLSDYDMEAQGELLADYIWVRLGLSPLAMRAAHRQYATQRGLYEQVLTDFLINPASKANLPGGT